MNVNFPSNVTPRNLYSSTTEISVSSSLMRKSLCIFFSCPKCMHRILLLEIVKLFVLGQWVIFQMYCCSWHSAVCIYLDLEVMQKLSTGVILNSRSETFCDAVFLYWTASLTKYSCLWRLEKVDLTQTWNFQSERKLFMRLGNLPHSPMLCRSFIIPNLQVAP